MGTAYGIKRELAFNADLEALNLDGFVQINDVQCPDARCRFFDGGALLYRDVHHLSEAGSRLFVGEVHDRLPF